MELHPKPAKVPPLKVNVDYSEWHRPKNAGQARPTTPANQAEIHKQVQKMLDCDVIARVKDQHAKVYSQVLLVNKPDRAKRFCIDFRALNMCISHMNLPLPLINQMLHRLGTHKPRYFTKFDMTKGYWQIALGEKFQLATAFITAFVIIKWKRIPMGIQPAASYFQYCMMVIVLAGLAYEICEAYIDDLIVH